VADARAPVADEDADYVKTEHPFPSPIPRHPNRRRTRELALLAPVHSFDGVTEILATARLDLYEGNYPPALCHQVHIAVPAAEAAFEDSPPPLSQPRRRYPLALFPELLRRCRHERKDAGTRSGARISSSHPPSQPPTGGWIIGGESLLRRLPLRE